MGWLILLAGGGVGLLIGSFIGAAALRLPRDEGIVFGRSHCDSCGRTLRARDMVPVLSCLASGGKCRTCKAPIDHQHVLAELGGAFVGVTAVWAGGATPEGFAIALFGWQALLLALLDARHYWLPYPLVASLGLSALILPVLAFLDGSDLSHTALVQVSGGALGFALLAAPALFYRAVLNREGMGAADPWLLGAIGLWVGTMGVVMTLLLAAAAGLAVAGTLRLSGRAIDGQSALPLGTLMTLSAYVLMVVGRVL
ncbi:prepilin peptidase [Croceicoccus ponticola]|uniref:Prepilin leader peptidase/N-methyltransferase n=1 Tax=Croceicoccus ponticola TaxID=2217664 RepID=A0A437H096_9SPHN|nr:A24 family peptidase [Croceicoccus ponticola]RVQ69037.1 prepilin peptidase [Croceicoccus ponticola]